MEKNGHDRDTIASNAVGIAAGEEREAHIAPNFGKGTASPDRGGEEGAANHIEDRENLLPRIGPYQIVKQVGESVAATVFLAEQQVPVRRRITLKIINDVLDWPQIVARFEAERQALMQMSQPNIAKVLDAGTRPSGQPYFVLEFVDGVPITAYCDEHQLTPRQRLELFVPVCQAVEYAHQRSLIHGDLHPMNVLVILHDGKPAPKILDFGVAQAMRRKPSEDNSSSELGDKTEYISPEQLDDNAQDIDARSDVYSLGVLLYELLTGTTPVKSERLKDVPREEALRLIREEEVSPPSTRLKESKDSLALLSAQRHLKPAALIKAVRGELDCVVMKALNEDRTQRYQTANDLARDIQHYLSNEAVEACPPSITSQLWKLARKQPRAAGVVAVVHLLLLAIAVAGASLAVWALRKEGQARKAEQEAVEKQKKEKKAAEKSKSELHLAEEARKATQKQLDRAKEAEKAARRSEEDPKAVLTFLQDRLLSAGRPAEVSLTDAFWAERQGKAVTLRQAVDMAAAQVAEAFADRPQEEASVRAILGLAYLNLGEPERAVQQYERGFELREALFGINHPDTVACRNRLAIAYRLAGHSAEADRLLDHHFNSSAHASALAVRGVLLLSQNNFVEAELKLRACLTIRQKIQPDDWTTFETKSILGEALLAQRKFVEAEPLLLSGYEGMEKRQTTLPSQDKVLLTKAVERLVRLYEDWNKRDKAEWWRKKLPAMDAATTR